MEVEAVVRRYVSIAAYVTFTTANGKAASIFSTTFPTLQLMCYRSHEIFLHFFTPTSCALNTLQEFR